MMKSDRTPEARAASRHAEAVENGEVYAGQSPTEEQMNALHPGEDRFNAWCEEQRQKGQTYIIDLTSDDGEYEGRINIVEVPFSKLPKRLQAEFLQHGSPQTDIPAMVPELVNNQPPKRLEGDDEAPAPAKPLSAEEQRREDAAMEAEGSGLDPLYTQADADARKRDHAAEAEVQVAPDAASQEAEQAPAPGAEAANPTLDGKIVPPSQRPRTREDDAAGYRQATVPDPAGQVVGAASSLTTALLKAPAITVGATLGVVGAAAKQTYDFLRKDLGGVPLENMKVGGTKAMELLRAGGGATKQFADGNVLKFRERRVEQSVEALSANFAAIDKAVADAREHPQMKKFFADYDKAATPEKKLAVTEKVRAAVEAKSLDESAVALMERVDKELEDAERNSAQAVLRAKKVGKDAEVQQDISAAFMSRATAYGPMTDSKGQSLQERMNDLARQVAEMFSNFLEKAKRLLPGARPKLA